MPIARMLSADHSLVEEVFQTSREPAAVLDLVLRIQVANRAFYDLFRLAPAEVVKRRIDELHFGSWNAAAFRDHLEKVLDENTQLENVPVELDLPGLGPRIFLLNARRIDGKGEPTAAILIELEDVIRQENAEET